MPRSSKQGNDTAVQDTNDNSIVSKCSIATQGYFPDDFLKLFVSKTSRRSPLINRGYYIRARAIDDVLKQFLSSHHDGQKQIISLGAGFDSAFFRLHSNRHLVNTTFYEVDFPDVVRRKAIIIRNNEALREQLLAEDYKLDTQSGIFLTSAKYHLLGVDLTDLDLLKGALKQTGINSQVPTLLLSECVLTYMEVSSSDALIQWAAVCFPHAVFLTYEQIHPGDAFGYVMQKHFEKLNSSLKAIRAYPTTEAQQQRFKEMGWQGTSALDMNTYYSTRVPLTERRRVEALEPFDEFEEWHLKCGHYAIIAGFNGDCILMKEYLEQGKDHQIISTSKAHLLSIQGDRTPSLLQTKPFLHAPVKRLRRYGHASATAYPDKILVSGGFEPRMHHSLSALSPGNGFLLFGGRSSPTKPTNSTIIITVNFRKQAAAENDVLSQIGSSVESSSNCPKRSETFHEAISEPIIKDSLSSSTNLTTHSGTPKENTNILLVDGDIKFASTQTESLSYICHHVESTNCEAPQPRWRHSAITAVRRGQECVAIYGGRSSGDVIFGDCWLFDIGRLKWEKLSITGDQPTPSHSHTACLWHDSRMVIACGLGHDLCPVTSVYAIDLESCVSQELKLSPPLPSRYSHTAHVVGDNLLLVGGINPVGAYCYTVAVINLTTATWRQHSLPAFDIERPLMVHGHTSELLTATKIIIIGGGGNCFSFGTHLNDTPVEIGVPL